MKTIYLLSFTSLLLFATCKSGNKQAQPQLATTASDTTATEKKFDAKPYEFPDVPVVITTQEEHIEYVAKHFWSKFDFADTAYVYRPDIVEQAWVDYINTLTNAPLDVAQTCIKDALRQAGKEKRIYGIVTGLAEKYLYEPNSPMRNEELFIPVLEEMLESPLLSDAEKIRPATLLKVAQRNRLGTKAADFTYTLANGKQGKLYGIHAKYTLIYFHNPGCHACEEIMAQIVHSMQIQHLISRKELAIITLYPDEDLAEWKKHYHELPVNWINGYDKEQVIQKKQIYDLKAIPTLYLLDKDKKVLLKDTTVPIMEGYFRMHGN